MLTPAQQQTALRAIGCAGELRSGAWKDCGPLAQIALLTGNTESDLERWDSIGNGDGPLTIRRIQESGNGFAGWPLPFLEALDRAWKAGASREALERIVRGETDTQTEAAVPAYDGPERRGAFTVAIDIKGLMLVIGLIGPLVAVITMVLQVRQDVRGNSIRMLQAETAITALQARMAEAERARVIYCAGRRAATSRDRSDSATIRLPDAGC